MLHAVIMAGGSGTRFWPASRRDRPKQLLNLTGSQSMLQETVERLRGLCPPERIMIMTNQRLVDAVRRQLPALPADAVIGEPCKRDTAPCVGWAGHLILHRDPDGVMMVMPSDHVITPQDKFQAAMRHAEQLVEQHPGRIVTFGIRPTHPADSFGYIERGDWISEDGELRTARVQRFREKPSVATAKEYVESGRFYWNSGIFVWKASTIVDAIAKHVPVMGEQLAKIGAAIGTDQEAETLAKEFEAIKGLSIDYAVMEQYEDEICVVEAPFTWDDLGGWQASARLLGGDDQGNTLVGKTLTVNSDGCIVRSTDDHVVVAVGMHDCIVVHTPDATLVADKHNEESIREVVRRLEQMGYDAHL